MAVPACATTAYGDHKQKQRQHRAVDGAQERRDHASDGGRRRGGGGGLLLSNSDAMAEHGDRHACTGARTLSHTEKGTRTHTYAHTPELVEPLLKSIATAQRSCISWVHHWHGAQNRGVDGSRRRHP